MSVFDRKPFARLKPGPHDVPRTRPHEHRTHDGRTLGGNFGETVIDSNLTRLANAVSVLYLRGSGGTSELRVLDFTVN